MPHWLSQVIETSRTKRGSIMVKLTSIQVFLNIIEGDLTSENESLKKEIEELERGKIPKFIQCNIFGNS